MRQAERDNDQLGVILRYCDRLDAALERFGRDYESFCGDIPFQDSCSLCLIQIGEAVGRLSGEFKEAHPQVEWSKVYGMRCHLVHGYEMFDAEIAWDAIERCVPPLRAFCEERFAG
ncbi:MAG: DUF86 domain-containing protein [Eggerthellaceae bacterium]|nr:DUF86 domain-containing protein [Eggerthellaceae bacterium]